MFRFKTTNALIPVILEAGVRDRKEVLRLVYVAESDIQAFLDDESICFYGKKPPRYRSRNGSIRSPTLFVRKDYSISTVAVDCDGDALLFNAWPHIGIHGIPDVACCTSFKEAVAPSFRRDALLPAIVQDAETSEVLMLAYMNADAFAETRRTGFAHYWSRSKNRLWKKGESSGHVQEVRKWLVGSKEPCLLLLVNQTGAACHEGYKSCFFRRFSEDGLTIIAKRMFDPKEMYKK